jgi:hypothetical protein
LKEETGMKAEIEKAIQLLQDAQTKADSEPEAAKATVQEAIVALDPIFTGNDPGPDPGGGRKP